MHGLASAESMRNAARHRAAFLSLAVVNRRYHFSFWPTQPPARSDIRAVGLLRKVPAKAQPAIEKPVRSVPEKRTASGAG